jgi:hypothetical protein
VKHSPHVTESCRQGSGVAQIALHALCCQDLQARSWLVGRTRTRTLCPRPTSSRATCWPTKPVAPVTSVVIEF